MRVLVVGLGSMGKRRIRLMKQYNSKLKILGVDTNIERAKSVQSEYDIDVACSLEEACRKNNFDCAFVCTSPLSHHVVIDLLMKYDIDIFTEINLVNAGYDRYIEEKKIKIFLSSTFLYRKDVQWLIQRVQHQNVNYIYHTGQYLPDWHPWEKYNEFFVGDEKTNGCREILTIEPPWLVECFGNITGISVLKNNLTDLKINYPDSYMLQIEHESGSKGLVAVDVVSRKATRTLEIYNETMQVYWDGTPKSLREWDYNNSEMKIIQTYSNIMKDNKYCENIIENAYMDEIDAFFTWLNGDASKVRYDFVKDAEIIKMIDQIEGKL